MTKKKWEFIKKNWKLGVHLVLRTRRFGINNKWWNHENGYFGWPLWKILLGIITVYPLIKNYKGMKYRSGPGIWFLPEDKYNLMFK